jgi:protein ImuB
MGEFERPLRIVVPREEYEARQELEEPARLLEPLLFIISAQLNDLVKHLAVQALAARRLTLTLELTDATTHLRRLDFPLPVRQARTLLKQVQLDLEAHPPEAAVRAVGVRLDAAAPRTVQNGLFRPAAPEPDKLHVTMARLAALVGDGAVGTPERLDTHRPDAYLLRPHALLTPPPERTVTRRAPLRLACRLYRPPLAATVRIMRERPVAIRSAMLTGTIQNAAGPWRTSGEWWAETRWARDEWDVALDDGALYRIFRDLDSARWFVDAMYD